MATVKRVIPLIEPPPGLGENTPLPVVDSPLGRVLDALSNDLDRLARSDTRKKQEQATQLGELRTALANYYLDERDRFLADGSSKAMDLDKFYRNGRDIIRQYPGSVSESGMNFLLHLGSNFSPLKTEAKGPNREEIDEERSARIRQDEVNARKELDTDAVQSSGDPFGLLPMLYKLDPTLQTNPATANNPGAAAAACIPGRTLESTVPQQDDSLKETGWHPPEYAPLKSPASVETPASVENDDSGSLADAAKKMVNNLATYFSNMAKDYMRSAGENFQAGWNEAASGQGAVISGRSADFVRGRDAYQLHQDLYNLYTQNPSANPGVLSDAGTELIQQHISSGGTAADYGLSVLNMLHWQNGIQAISSPSGASQ